MRPLVICVFLALLFTVSCAQEKKIATQGKLKDPLVMAEIEEARKGVSLKSGSFVYKGGKVRFVKEEKTRRGTDE